MELVTASLRPGKRETSAFNFSLLGVHNFQKLDEKDGDLYLFDRAAGTLSCHSRSLLRSLKMAFSHIVETQSSTCSEHLEAGQ